MQRIAAQHPTSYPVSNSIEIAEACCYWPSKCTARFTGATVSQATNTHQMQQLHATYIGTT